MAPRADAAELKKKILELYERRRSLAIVASELQIPYRTIWTWLERDAAFAEQKAQIDARIRAEMVEQARSTVMMSLVGLKDATGEFYIIKPRPEIALRLLENYGKIVGFESVVPTPNRADWLDYLNSSSGEGQQKS